MRTSCSLWKSKSSDPELGIPQSPQLTSSTLGVSETFYWDISWKKGEWIIAKNQSSVEGNGDLINPRIAVVSEFPSHGASSARQRRVLVHIAVIGIARERDSYLGSWVGCVLCFLFHSLDHRAFPFQKTIPELL